MAGGERASMAPHLPWPAMEPASCIDRAFPEFPWPAPQDWQSRSCRSWMASRQSGSGSSGRKLPAG